MLEKILPIGLFAFYVNSSDFKNSQTYYENNNYSISEDYLFNREAVIFREEEFKFLRKITSNYIPKKIGNPVKSPIKNYIIKRKQIN